MENHSRALELSLQPGITAPSGPVSVLLLQTLGLLLCTAEDIKPTERKVSVYWLWLASPQSASRIKPFGLAPNVREWTEARARSSAGFHSTIRTPRQVYLPTCLF